MDAGTAVGEIIVCSDCGVDKLLTKSLGIPAYLVDNPLTCVVQGTIRGFGMLNMIRRNLPQV